MNAEKIYLQPVAHQCHPWASRVVLIGVILLGLFFRFHNLDQKIYWDDEVSTSIRQSGHTYEEMRDKIANGQVIQVKDLRQYQYPRPSGSMADPLRALAIEDTQHAPLYDMILWSWVRFFGNSVAVIRSFSAFTSILALIGVWWLCRELFKSSWVSWITIALMAVSPFHLVYAQEARPYSLYILTIFISSAALLRAMRLKSKLSWAIYSGTLVLGLYTHILFLIVLLAHGVYVAILERGLSRTLLGYLAAACAGLLGFTPWIWVIVNVSNRFSAMGWAGVQQQWLSSFKRWVGYFSRAFLDVGIEGRSKLYEVLPWIPLIFALLVLFLYSLWFVYRHTDKRIWLFIFTLTGVTGIIFAIPDLVLGYKFATTRYLTPAILGIQLAVAYLLAVRLERTAEPRSPSWQVIAAGLLSVEIVSCIMISNAQVWWNKRPGNSYVPQAAAIINRSQRPIVISDGGLISIQMLGHALDENVHLQIIETPSTPEIPQGYTDVFLFNTSEKVRFELKNKYSVNIKNVVGPLWIITLPGNDLRRSSTSELF
jgi:uncharacterized membrane protein